MLKNGRGFRDLIDLIREFDVTSVTIEESVNSIKSMLGFIDTEDSFQYLSQRQIAILRVIGDLRCVKSEPQEEQMLALGVFEYGRVYLDSVKLTKHAKRLHVLGYIEPSSEHLAEIASIQTKSRQQQSQLEQESIEFLESLDPEQLNMVIEFIIDGLDHVDPILYYVKETCFTNFANFNNLLPKNNERKPGYVLVDLLITPLKEWTLEEKLLIACSYFVLKAGFRGEEFSGRILAPETVNHYFDCKLEQYGTSLPEQLMQTPEVEASLVAKAAKLAELKIELKKDFTFYRAVNGLNFAKDEKFIASNILTTPIDKVPIAIVQYMRANMGVSRREKQDTQDYFSRGIRALFDKLNSNLELLTDNIEFLLALVVNEAICELNADIGMTRGLRNIRQWQTYIEAGDFEAAVDMTKSEYYCAVWASAEMWDKYRKMDNGEDTLIKIQNACSNRMIFNGWHYMPSHFVEQVKESRHYYYAPAMFDTAVHSNQHHGGHIFADVKYSIRAPSPLTFAGKTYNGMNDIRLMRQTGGQPFSEEELFRAHQYSNYLRWIYQAVSDLCLQRDCKINISSYTKAWYETSSYDYLQGVAGAA